MREHGNGKGRRKRSVVTWMELFRRCWSSLDIVLDAYVGAKATCNVPEHVARSLEHSDCKAKAPVSRREEQSDERLKL